MAVKTEKPIKNFLLDFGLTDKEVTVYLTLLKSGPNTIMNLARETGIKRSTTHNTVEELVKKGLVSQTNYGERRMVVAEDPQKLEFLLEQRKWEMKKLEDNMPTIVKTIYDNIPQSKENTKIEVKYYKGKKEVQYVYEQSFKADKYHSFADLEKYYGLFPGTSDNWVKSFNNKNREAWDILIDTPTARDIVSGMKFERYHIKFLPKKNIIGTFDFADYIIFDNKLAIIQLDSENPLATVIESESIALSLEALHKSMWEMLPE